MPQIIVTADRGVAFGEGAVTLRERVNVADFESQHFATQLVERLGWAVEDADRATVEDADPAEQQNDMRERRRGAPDRRREAAEPAHAETADDASEPVPAHATG